MTRITGVDFVAVPSTDWKRSRAFYVDTLALRPDETGDAEFWVGNTCFGIYEPTTFGLEFAPQTTAHIALHVDDVAATRAEFEAKGIEFDGGRLRHGGVSHGLLRRSGRQRADAAPPLLAARVMQVERIDYIRVPVTDMDAANRFYGEAARPPARTRTLPTTTGSSTKPATPRSPS